MKRTKPLKRKHWIRRKPARRTATTDYDYMAAVRSLPCCVAEMTGHTQCGPWRYYKGRVKMEANHAGVKPGTALKAPDDSCIPMCQWHHRDWTDHIGVFHRWDKEKRREWADAQIASTRSTIAEMRRAA